MRARSPARHRRASMPDSPSRQLMPDEIIIRPIQESDFAAYRALRLEALKAHPESFGSDYAEQAADPESVWLDRIRGSIDGKTSRLFLAETAGKLAGMTGVYRNRGVKV